MAAIVRDEPGQARSQSFIPVSHMGAVPQVCGPSAAASQVVSREPNWKWSSWGITWHHHEMLALWVDGFTCYTIALAGGNKGEGVLGEGAAWARGRVREKGEGLRACHS